MNHLLRKLSRGPAIAPSWRAEIVSLCDGGVPVPDFEAQMGLPRDWRTHKLWT